MIVFLLSLIGVLVVLLGFSVFFMIRFARYVMTIEDLLPEAIEVHERTIAAFDGVLQIKAYFDDPSLIRLFQEIVEDAKVCRLATARLIERFTSIKKYRFIINETDTNSEQEDKG